jgi:hypothetical protein
MNKLATLVFDTSSTIKHTVLAIKYLQLQLPLEMLWIELFADAVKEIAPFWANSLVENPQH